MFEDDPCWGWMGVGFVGGLLFLFAVDPQIILRLLYDDVKNLFY